MHQFARTFLHATALVALSGAGATLAAQPASAQSETQVRLNIPAGSLGSAIARLGRQASVMITVDPDLVRGKRTSGLQGTYSPRQGLDALLRGSGVVARSDGKGGYVLTAAPAPRSVAGEADEPSPPAAPVATPPERRAPTEIIVTGQKAERTLLDTQASVAVTTAQDIREKDITSFREAFRTMGNVMDGDWLDTGFIIRGVNSEGLVSGAPLAALYVDGAEQSRMGTRRGARGLWDVEQVEVYRGPQSTLTGRAAMAGAIYVNTRDPGYAFDAAARLSAGELDTREAAIALGGPVVEDVLAVRFAAEYQRRDSEVNYPDFEQYDRYGKLAEDEYYQLRGKVRLDPLPGLTAHFSYAYSYDSPAYDDIGGPGLGWDFADQRGDFNAPYYQEVRSTKNHSSASRIAYELSPEITLSSITSLVNTHSDRGSVNAGTAGETLVLTGGEKDRVFTQELRLNYEGATGIRGVAGLYYNFSRSSADRIITTPRGTTTRTDDSTLLNRARNYALFGEITVPVVDRVSLIAGGRIDHTDMLLESHLTRSYADNSQPVSNVDYDGTRNETEFLPKLGVDVSLSPETKLGFVLQRGWRPGGITRDSDGVVMTFGPEKATTYESSLRHNLGSAGTVSLNVFYTDWTDQQIQFDTMNSDGSRTRSVANAGKSRLYGGELEAKLNPLPNISGFLSLGYVNSRFTDFQAADLGDFTGLSFPQAPDWTVAAGVDYRPRQGFFVGADIKYTGTFLARDMQNAPIDELGDYLIANARVGYSLPNVSLMVFAENLFDKQYYTYFDRTDYGYGDGEQDYYATMGRSRVIGVTLQARY
ncbi:TonB-dependent receptor [Altererythrobacter indicus]|uniref:TonB-dependent receptor n=1 Tax=Altericroceibacterium indicum TaxID=374177 RepID=A0A845ADS0_9SPHN|nr:TonB-dependent receptor [Altericroceibacterium indicum]MXP26945.1 TonB-dependent receptor [Altericroceibacterium indicum]